jgi:hypothetical protein
MVRDTPGAALLALRSKFLTWLTVVAGGDIEMSKAAEFAVILKMNPMFSDLGADGQPSASALAQGWHFGLQRGRILLQNMTKLTAVARNE